MENVEKKAAMAFLSKLRKQVNDSYYKGVEIFPHHCLSFSCGVAEYDEGIYNSAELIGKADQAMYYAKSQGKNNVQLYDSNIIFSTSLNHEKEIELLEQQVKFFLYKDVYTYKHSRRVYQYAKEFSNNLKLQLSDYEKKLLISGALIHDIGKINIPSRILMKDTKLTEEELQMLKKHPEWGANIISELGYDPEIIPIVVQHHERFDGFGYPAGLKGNEINPLARLLNVIDSFDAMTNDRPYKNKLSFEEACNEIERCKGTQFDPEMADQFIIYIRSSEYNR